MAAMNSEAIVDAVRALHVIVFETGARNSIPRMRGSMV
jgi:hypothetical protein